MRIALIFPSYTHKVFSENLAVVDKEFCLAPPIILAYVAAILEKHGHKVILLDTRALGLTKEKALEKLKAFKPDFLGFRAEAYYFHDALNWLSYLKKNLNVPIIAGGPNLSMYPKEVFFHKQIDYGIAGEAIDSLPRLLAAIEYGDDITKIEGLIYRNNGDVVINSAPPKSIDFDSYPFPARHLLPNEKYYSFISQKKNFTIMLTSTGCPFHCSFCAIHSTNQYRARSPKNVVDEIELCYKEFRIREIDFFDAALFLDKNRLLEIFREMKRKGLKIEWSCRSRVDIVDKEILQEAARAGCRQIYYGIESADASVLRAINKEVTLDQVKQAIKWSKEFGIRTLGFFMVGNPGDTNETVQHTMQFAKDLDLDFVQVCRAIAKPGTDFENLLIEKTGRDYWREHVAGSGIDKRIPAPWVNLKEEELEKLTKKFYLDFYLSPRIVLSRIIHSRSITELIRYIRVAIKMFISRSEV